MNSLTKEDINILLSLLEREIDSLMGFVSIGNELHRYNKYSNIALKLKNIK